MFRLLLTYLQCLWHIIQSVLRVVLTSIAIEIHLYYPSSADTKSIKKESPNITESQPSRLFALIIGINEYKTVRQPLPNLKGAVPDADLVQSYLQNHLGVPNSQIRNLRDSEATRAAILHEINALITDDRIQRGDPIVIFYAGHGSTAPTPKGWKGGGPTTQLLLPHDYLCENEEGQKVHGIPDRTMSELLGRLASAKGDNITVIFDCGYSGSRTDEVDSKSSFLVRGIDTVEELPADLDRDIIVSSRTTKVSNGFAHSSLISHVFLAACGAAEHAKEFDAKGLFTTALLSALVAWGTDIVTYEDLLQLIHALPGQNPQCEGFFRTRILFDGKASGHDRVLYKVRRTNNRYVMEVGASHGITDGAQFTVFEDRESQATQLGIIVARQTDRFTTTLDIISDASHHPEEGYALQTRVGTKERLRLHVNTIAPLSLIETLKKTASQDFLLVEKEKAELSLTLEHEGVVVNILDSFVTALGLTRMPLYIEPNADAISYFIDVAAHFHFYLRQKSQMQSLQGKIDVVFTEVFQSEEEYDDNMQPVILPIGPNLNRENIIEVQDGKMYGVKITNNSNMALYPSLFFFDNSDLSITSYYQPPTSGAKIVPPLLPNSSVTIGYGAGSGVPYCYRLRDGQEIDIGHLKLFLSTESIDLSHVPSIHLFLMFANLHLLPVSPIPEPPLTILGRWTPFSYLFSSDGRTLLCPQLIVHSRFCIGDALSIAHDHFICVSSLHVPASICPSVFYLSPHFYFASQLPLPDRPQKVSLALVSLTSGQHPSLTDSFNDRAVPRLHYTVGTFGIILFLHNLPFCFRHLHQASSKLHPLPIFLARFLSLLLLLLFTDHFLTRPFPCYSCLTHPPQPFICAFTTSALPPSGISRFKTSHHPIPHPAFTSLHLLHSEIDNLFFLFAPTPEPFRVT